jgi:voltage-gated potassium channel
LAAILVTAPSAVLMFQIERNAPNANIKTLWDGIWWGAATVTTVGYGDKYPTTNLGRFLAILVMIVGVSLVGVITATVASWFVKADVDDPKEIQFKRVLDRLESIEQKLNDLTGTEESAKVET